jgi:hypothetical protein
MGSRFLITAASLAGGLALAAGAEAGAVAVVNSGFESPAVALVNAGPITGWQIGGNGGVMNTANGVFTAPSGSQVGYAGSNYGILFQDVGAVVAGATYTLSVDVGVATGLPVNDYRLLLGVWGPGGHDLATATIFAAAFDPVAITPGTFSLVSLTGVAPNMNGDLVIFLENSNAFTIATQTGWDNVSLTSSAPEPATWALMLMGFGGLGLALRARRGVAVA